MRKAHFLAILLSLWAPFGAHITWITDEDEFVANEQRHDDALLAAGRLSSMYLNQPMGIFRLNTTAQDLSQHSFEDLCAIPDLTAGFLAEVRRGLPWGVTWGVGESRTLASDLTFKAEILLDWFMDPAMRLRKTLISIDSHGAQFAVRELRAVPDVDTASPRGSLMPSG